MNVANAVVKKTTQQNLPSRLSSPFLYNINKSILSSINKHSTCNVYFFFSLSLFLSFFLFLNMLFETFMVADCIKKKKKAKQTETKTNKQNKSKQTIKRNKHKTEYCCGAQFCCKRSYKVFMEW